MKPATVRVSREFHDAMVAWQEREEREWRANIRSMNAQMDARMGVPKPRPALTKQDRADLGLRRFA